MSRLHVSDSKKEIVFANKEQIISSKPKGLWYGINKSWINWCKDEMPHWVEDKFVHEVYVDKRYILSLSSHREMMAFTKKFWKPLNGLSSRLDFVSLIDWPLVSKFYSGIEIAPYQENCRLAGETNWYYGWDCASGCVWDSKGIVKIKRIDTSKVSTHPA